MHKILVIDDDSKRSSKIKELLLTKLHEVEIHQAENVIKAKQLLKNNYYFTLFLDMALPYRDGDTVNSSAGISLLKSVAKGRFKNVPSRVIGFTALAENIEEKESEFEILGFKLYEARVGDYSWFNIALSQVEYSLQAIKSYNKLPTDIAVLSIHGIETGGDWQKELYTLVEQKYPDCELSNLQYEYKAFPVIRFIVPPLRNKMVEHFKKQLTIWLNENKTKRIVCFSHSFGTYILIKAFEAIEDKSILKNVDLIILSGSVLNQNYDFSFLSNLPNVRLVNECAKQDGALLFSKACVFGTGMGGRLGFRGLMNNKFSNRTYQGGHSVFFENECKIVSEFWIPLIDPFAVIQPFNKSEDRKRDKLAEYFARISSKIKIIYYLIFIYSIYALVFAFIPS